MTITELITQHNVSERLKNTLNRKFGKNSNKSIYDIDIKAFSLMRTVGKKTAAELEQIRYSLLRSQYNNLLKTSNTSAASLLDTIAIAVLPYVVNKEFTSEYKAKIAYEIAAAFIKERTNHLLVNEFKEVRK